MNILILGQFLKQKFYEFYFNLNNQIDFFYHSRNSAQFLTGICIQFHIPPTSLGGGGIISKLLKFYLITEVENQKSEEKGWAACPLNVHDAGLGSRQIF